MKYLLVTFFLLINNCYGQTVYGSVTDTETGMPLEGAEIYLVSNKPSTRSKADVIYFDGFMYRYFKSKVKTISDSSGKFKIVNIDPNLYSLVVSYFITPPKYKVFGVRQAVVTDLRLKRDSSIERNFTLEVTCPYDKTKDQTFCPRCKKGDKVVTIINGLPMFDSTGNINGKPMSEYHLAGCIVDSYCNPTRHCNRCDLDF